MADQRGLANGFPAASHACSTASSAGCCARRAPLTKPYVGGTWASRNAAIIFEINSIRVSPGGREPCDGKSSKVIAIFGPGSTVGASRDGGPPWAIGDLPVGRG